MSTRINIRNFLIKKVSSSVFLFRLYKEEVNIEHMNKITTINISHEDFTRKIS